MLARAYLALCILLGALCSSALAQQARVVQDCSGYTTPVNQGSALTVDQTGKLCTTGATITAPSGAATAAITPQTTTNPALVAKSTGGNLYGYHATMGGTAGFIAILNASTVPAANAAISPVECTAIAANATFRTRQDIADRYGAGIVLLATSSCTTYTAVTPTLMAASVQ